MPGKPRDKPSCFSMGVQKQTKKGKIKHKTKQILIKLCVIHKSGVKMFIFCVFHKVCLNLLNILSQFDSDRLRWSHKLNTGHPLCQQS